MKTPVVETTEEVLSPDLWSDTSKSPKSSSQVKIAKISDILNLINANDLFFYCAKTITLRFVKVRLRTKCVFVKSNGTSSNIVLFEREFFEE